MKRFYVLALSIAVAALFSGCDGNFDSGVSGFAPIGTASVSTQNLPPVNLPRSDKFDYYVLSLSWSPEYCAGEGRQRNAVQCTRPYAFVVHGLWPQYKNGGFPSNCESNRRVPQSTIDDMLNIMPSGGLVIHQWRKHGSCSELSPDDYFAATKRAFNSLNIPKKFQNLDRPLVTNSSDLRKEFLSANPSLKKDSIALYCGGNYLREVRLCMTQSLQAQQCGKGISDRCRGDITLRPVR